MSLSPGGRLGPYEVVALVGAGAMGEVYRARDPRLGRDVAIKVLASAFAGDTDRLTRFEQEARAAAALNHPNILAVFDIGQVAGSPYIVSELLKGETLRERLKAGPLAVREAVEYSVQIAQGLAAAHEKHIVHRDIKPDNLFITTDGRVKILDFGLAKLTEPEPIGGVGSVVSTNLPGTQPGLVLGTLAYMSPEQARGIPADYRADIFSFGAILYEMLSGQSPFQRDTAADTMSAILKEEPAALSSTRRQVSPVLERIVERCLEKNPARRFQSTEDLAFALVGASAGSEHAMPGSVAPRARPSKGRRAIALTAAAAVVAMLVVVAVAALAYLRQPSDILPLVRLNVTAPAGATLPADPMVRISPDGTKMAFIAATSDGVRRIWLRPLNSVDFFPLNETSDATSPFWSSDGRSLGFFSDGQLKRVDVADGSTATLCAAPNAVGGTWNADGVIVFSSEGRLQRIAASGGGVGARLDGINGGREGATFAYPTFLPDGRHFLYLDTGSGAVGDAAIYAAALDSSDRSLVLKPAVSNALYSRGYLFFLRDTSLSAQLSATLVAQPFDASRLTLSGAPVPIVEQVQRTPVGAPSGVFSVSDRTLAYREGVGMRGFPTELTWFDRAGKPLGTVGERADYGDVELSPDGTRASVSELDPGTGRDIWVFDLVRGIPTRFTTDPADESASVWSPDGATIMFSSRRKGHLDLYQKASSGAGTEQEFLVDNGDNFDKLPLSWSSDGRFLLYSMASVSAAVVHPQLWASPLTGDRKPFPVLNDAHFNQFPGRLSPDGRFVAYASTESGQNEIYVASFPSLSDKWRISTTGGSWPRWRRDGKEIYFLDNTKLMAAAVDGQQSRFSVGAVQMLFEAPWRVGQRSAYDVAPDGRRFFGAVVVEQPTPSPVTLVVNWLAELKK